MSTLLLVRHGQASFGAKNYDKLSKLGEEQCRQLGRYLVQHGEAYNRAFTGPLQRHQGSAALVKEVYDQAGMPFPDIEMLPGLNEFHWDELMQVIKTELVHKFEHLRTLKEDYTLMKNPARKQRIFQLLFEEATKLWVNEAFVSPHVESWAHFSERADLAISHMIEGQPKSCKYIAFTSGGPIAVASRRAMDLHPGKALELMWSLRNAAMVEYFFTEDRFSLSAYNTHPHLETAAEWTYR